MSDARHVVAVAGFVSDEARRVLLVRVASRGWEMPGGRVEAGEDLLHALRREVAEEAGCRVTVDRLVGVYSKLTAPVMLLHVFACRYVDGEPRGSEPAVPEVGWFSPDEAIDLVVRPPSSQRLQDALAGDESILYRAYRLDPYEQLHVHTI